MNNKFFIVVLFSVLLSACSSTKNNGNVVVLKPATGYEKVNFKRLINPTFSADYDGKGVEFTAVFSNQDNIVTDLPENLKIGYVRIILSGDGGVLTRNVLVPKNNSDIVFDSSAGDVWKIKARAMLYNAYGVHGGTQNSIILVVDDASVIEKIEDRVKRLHREAIDKYK